MSPGPVRGRRVLLLGARRSALGEATVSVGGLPSPQAGPGRRPWGMSGAWSRGQQGTTAVPGGQLCSGSDQRRRLGAAAFVSACRLWHARGQRLGSILPYQVDRYDARQLCLEAGVAYLVVVGEDGACRCPFGVRRQQRVGRLSGTTALPPSHDKTHQLTNPREHLFPRLACYGARVSPRVWRSKAT
jgi:hypothetical protein